MNKDINIDSKYLILGFIIFVLVIIDVISIAKLGLFDSAKTRALEFVSLTEERVENFPQLSDEYVYYYDVSCFEDDYFDEAYVLFSSSGQYYFTGQKGNKHYAATEKLELKTLKASKEGDLFSLPNDLKDKKAYLVNNETCNINYADDAYYLSSDEACFTLDSEGSLISFKNDKNCVKDIVSIPAEVNNVKLKKVDLMAFRDLEIDVLDFSNAKNLSHIERSADYETGMGNIIRHVNIKNLDKLEKIGEFAFTKFSLKSITLENLPNLTEIASDAFAENEISEFNVSGLSGIKVLYSAFRDNKITELNLSAFPNLEELSFDAFSNNEISNLTLFQNPKLRLIGYRAFSNNKISDLTLRESNSLEKIDQEAFANNEIERLNINANKLKEIGEGAFSNNKITALYLDKANNLEKIASKAFSNNLIKNIELKEGVTFTCVARDAFDEIELLEVSSSILQDAC